MKRYLQLVGLMAIMAMGAGGCEAVAAADGTFSGLYDSYLNKCGNCHAPANRSTQEGIETTLDFSSAAAAHASIVGKSASGLESPLDGCNGVAFVAAGDPSKSLLVAVLDQPTRQAFDLGGKDCGNDNITDMTLKAGDPPAGFVSSLKTWIENGAPND